MLDNVEMQIKNAFKSHEIKLTSDMILDKVVEKADLKKKPLFKGLIMAMSSLMVVSTVLAIVLFPNDHKLSLKEKVEQKSFIADVINVTETLLAKDDNRSKNVKKSKKYLENDILGEITSMIEEAYADISQTFLYSLDKIELNYEIEEGNYLVEIGRQEYEYNYSCNLYDSVNYYYNLLEEEEELQGIIISEDKINSFFGNYIGIKTKFNSDGYISESRFAFTLIDVESFIYYVREKEDGTKEYCYCVVLDNTESELFKYSIKKSNSEAVIEYENSLSKTNILFIIINDNDLSYEVSCEINSWLLESKFTFTVTYSDEYQDYFISDFSIFNQQN